MKKWLTLLLAGIMLFATFGLVGCNEEKQPTLYVYTNAGFPPYEYLNEKGEVAGVDVDLMKEIGSILGYKVVIKDIEFNSILNEVAKNEYAVGAAGMTQKPDRDAVALASKVYSNSVQYVIADKNAFAEGEKVSLEELATYVADKKIGVQKGTTGCDLVKADYEALTVEYSNAILASQDIGTALKAVVIDKLPAQSIANDNANLACWEVDAESESYVLYFNKNATELVQKVNEILDVMTRDSSNFIQYLISKHTEILAD